jgi:hypothetical protein
MVVVDIPFSKGWSKTYAMLRTVQCSDQLLERTILCIFIELNCRLSLRYRYPIAWNLLLLIKINIHLYSCIWSHVNKYSQVFKYASNFGVTAELRRFPLIYNILQSICKYRIRFKLFKGDLLYHALTSQTNLKHNSWKTATYSQFNSNLLKLTGFV